jgi:hypothetical protein
MKRIVLMMLVAFVAGTSTVYGQGKPQCPKIVLDDPEFYLSDVGDDIFGIRDSKGIWRFYHLSGNPLNGKTYKSPLNQKPVFNSGVCPVQQVDKEKQWILLKKDGSEIVLPNNISRVSNFKDGLALAEIDWQWCYIDVTGKKVFPQLKPNANTIVLDVKPLRCNRRAYDDGNEYKKGFIDKTGKVVIPAKYTRVRDFTDNLAIVSEDWDDKVVKVIDVTGREISIIPERFSRNYLTDFVNGVATTYDEETDKPVIIDKDMNIVASFYIIERGFYKDGGSDALAIVVRNEGEAPVLVNTKGEYVADAFINDDRTTSSGKVEENKTMLHNDGDDGHGWVDTGFAGTGFKLTDNKIGFIHGRDVHSFNSKYFAIGTFDKSGHAHAIMYEVVGHGKQDLDGSIYEILEPHHVIMDKNGAPVVEIVVPKED